ncbi:MAG: hypothetical protein HQL76_13450 [Magnetococcales bacterium]|nr:hypothetical protein [Magnetococcales bacterium]
MRHPSCFPVTLTLFCFLSSWSLMAREGNSGEKNWYPGFTVQGVAGDYSGSSMRERFLSEGLFFSTDWFERYGMTLGYNHTSVTFVSPTQDIEQDAFFASARINLTPDLWHGRLGVRLDGHLIDNDDATHDTDDVKVAAPVISFTPFDQTWHVEAAVAFSDYYGDLEVWQVSPAIGMAFNEKLDWISLRPTLIDVSNPTRAQGLEDAQALDIKWNHWFGPDNLLRLDNLKVGGMVGEKIFGVDLDGASVYNLADAHQGGASLGLEWRIGTQARLLLMGGHEAYENKSIADKYSSNSLYLSYSLNW